MHYIAALGGLLVASAASAQVPPHPADRDHQAAVSAQQVAALSNIAVAAQAIARDARPSAKDQANAAEDRQRAKDQLRADQTSAFWTMFAAIAALVEIPLAAVGIFFIWKTLGATHAAVVEAGAATEAAQAAVGIAEKTAHLQLRPYVYIMDEVVHAYAIHGRPEHRGMEPADHAPVTFSIKNFGQTPAKRVRFRGRGFIGEHWTEGGLVDLETAATIHRADLPPGFDRKIEGYAVNDLKKDFKSILRGDKSAFFEGRIEYEDANGQKYVTNVRRACTGEAIHSGTFIFTEEGNDAT